MKEEIKQKEEQLDVKDKELQQIRQQLEALKQGQQVSHTSSVESKIEKYLVDSKSKLVEGLDNICHQINDSILHQCNNVQITK